MPIPPGIKPFSVSRLTQAVKARLEEHFATVFVEGEISGFKHHSSGHMYFNLKDSGAVLPCMMPRSFNLRLNFHPHEGLAVVARGGISVYDAQGKYQFYVEELQPKGVGAAELALRELRDKLRAKGYFEAQRKRPLPRYPRLVSLLTSGSGAAVRDMLELLRHRWPCARVVVRSSRVQGPGAAEDIAANLRLLSGLHKRKQMHQCAVIIGRGGGAREDLAAFNEEIVADAIYECSVPVISAVGHEIDVTLADLVADHRAETPSAAVGLLTPDREEMMDDLLRVGRGLREAVRNRVAYAKQSVDVLATRPALRKPFDRIRQAEQRLDEIALRMQRGAGLAVDRGQRKIEAAMEQLDALSPLGVLKRGYSLTQRGDGSVVRAVGDVSEGEILQTRLAEGSILSKVISSEDKVRPTASPKSATDEHG